MRASPALPLSRVAARAPRPPVRSFPRQASFFDLIDPVVYCRHDPAIELGGAAGGVVTRLALQWFGDGRLMQLLGGRRRAFAAWETGGFGNSPHLFPRGFQLLGFLRLEGAEIEIAGIPEDAQTFLGHHATSATRSCRAFFSLKRLTTSTSRDFPVARNPWALSGKRPGAPPAGLCAGVYSRP